jgi:para-nitrobenzyl esterase
MPYAYGNLWRHADRYDKADRELSDKMQNYWVNFVKSGNPNGDNLPKWEQYTQKQKQVIQFDSEVKMIDDPYEALYAYLDKAQNE